MFKLIKFTGFCFLVFTVCMVYGLVLFFIAMFGKKGLAT
jgi:hypothetical protein